VFESIEATAGLKLLQTPPAGLPVKVAVASGHNSGAIDVTSGNGFTVTSLVVKQPVALEVKVMIAVPRLTPVITPEPVAAVATAVLLLLHVPVMKLVNKVVPSKHIELSPPIALGAGVTVNNMVL
jgi:hypothetical protein